MDERLEQLKIQLELQEWPDFYLYKFIIPNQTDLLERVLFLFNNNQDIKTNTSSQGKYISITAKEWTKSTNEIIEKYKIASQINGLIAL